MTPKEKAEYLIDSFVRDGYDIVMSKTLAKRCALIAVDEIINSRPLEPNNVDWDDCGATHKYWYDTQKEEALKFWQEVKQELTYKSE